MNLFIEVRDKIRNFISKHERITLCVWHGFLGLAALLTVRFAIGYSSTVSNLALVLILSLVCAFIPVSGISFIVIIYGLIHLVSLSVDVAVTAVALLAMAYLVCAFYGVTQNQNILYIPVFYHIGMPFVIPVEAGLLGGIQEVSGVVCGGIFSYFLKAVRDNAGSFKDDSVDLSILELFQKYIFGSTMFYVYLAALVVMFLVVHVIHEKNISHAWIVATVAGVLSEFVIMLTGELMTGNESQIPKLLLGNFAALVVGLVINYFMLDLDYSRTERVQFEDDDYYYYVTAVPKIKIAQEKITVKTITNVPRRRKVHRKDSNEHTAE